MGLFRCEREQSGGTPSGFEIIYSSTSKTASHSFDASENDLLLIVSYGFSSSTISYTRFDLNTITNVSFNDRLTRLSTSSTYGAGTFTVAIASGGTITATFKNSCDVKVFRPTTS